MAVGVLMPKAGITVEECVITDWLKKKGDHVNVGDVLFTYETDKASFECESTAEGTLLDIFYEDGDEVPVLELRKADPHRQRKQHRRQHPLPQQHLHRRQHRQAARIWHRES